MIERIIDKQTHDLGGGFEVGRVLPFAARKMVGPFIFFDHMGPKSLAAGIPKELDVRPHPHIGISTVTYLYDGALTHRDSLGFHQEIRPQEVNWMVTGSGITHSERFDYAREHGAHMHGIQAWVALPDGEEDVAPAFYHHEGADLPEWEEAGLRGRLIAGTAEGMKAAVKTHSPMFYMHWNMDKAAARTLPAEYEERAIYVATGAVDAIVMALGGAPIGERYLLWNFVSSSKDKLRAAKEDWVQGRMKLPDEDNLEFIPFPEKRTIK